MHLSKYSSDILCKTSAMLRGTLPSTPLFPNFCTITLFKRLILQLRLSSEAPLMAPRTTQSFRMERVVLKELSDGERKENPMMERSMCPQDQTVCRSLFTNLKKSQYKPNSYCRIPYSLIGKLIKKKEKDLIQTIQPEYAVISNTVESSSYFHQCWTQLDSVAPNHVLPRGTQQKCRQLFNCHFYFFFFYSFF